MKKVLDWIKSNPITVASIAVVVISLVFVGWVHIQGSTLTQEMAKRQNTINQFRALIARSVRIPPEEPDGPERTISNVTINPVAIDQISMLYDRMEEEYRAIFQRAVQINRGPHQPLIDNLFPTTNDPAAPFLARDAYLAAFAALFEPYPPGAEDQWLPRLDAGMPPNQQEITDAVARVDAEFRSSPAMLGQQLTPEDMQMLFQEKQAKAIEMLNERARDIHIYAEANPTAAQYPFQVMPWGREVNQPTMSQLWEGQLELWIQQDLVRAIARTNHVLDPNVNVINAPVKRLIRIEVVPGYVGLHTAGGLYPSTNVQRTDGAYPPPAAGRTGDSNSRVSDNFHVGPTGRVSNALYDVRHARLEVVIDYARLPELFNNLAAVNFMTVLSLNLEDVDEYQALEQGFIYGSDDVVRATIVVETIWLRDWTQQLMPPLTKQYVGIDEPTDLSTTGAPGLRPSGAPGGRGGYDYGGIGY